MTFDTAQRAALAQFTFKQLGTYIRNAWPDMPPRLRFYVSVMEKIPPHTRLHIDESLTIGYFLYYSKGWKGEDAAMVKAELKRRHKNGK